MKRIVFVWLCMFLAAPPVMARKVGGVDVPDSIRAGDYTLLLNGAGVRKKFVFVKVYAGALYLRKKSSSSRGILNADSPMAVVMTWIHDNVDGKDVVEAWNKGFLRTTGGDIAPLKDRIDRFNAVFPETLHKGDVFEFIYTPNHGTDIIVNGQKKDTIPGLDFKKALYGQWLMEKGMENALKKLRKKMLSKK